MKTKDILKFYFFAEKIDAAFENLILKRACSGAGRGGYSDALNICGLLEEKSVLCTFRAYLDGVICGLPAADVRVLRGYAALRCGISLLSEDGRRAVKRAVLKFKRRARRLASFGGAMRIAVKYICLACPPLPVGAEMAVSAREIQDDERGRGEPREGEAYVLLGVSAAALNGDFVIGRGIGGDFV